MPTKQFRKPQFFTLQVKIKSFSPVYLLKIILYLKKTFSFVSNLVFMPNRNKEVVVLRSPFIYKSSRLKFRFTTSTAVLYIRFLTSHNTNLNFLIENQLLRLVKNLYTGSAVYSCKKKQQNYFF